MNHAELTKLFQEYFEPIYRYVYFRTGQPMDAEDIVSEVFRKVCQSYGQFEERPTGTLKSWIYTIAKHEIATFYRSRKPTESYEEWSLTAEETHAAEQTLETTVDQSIIWQDVMAAVHTLPERKREIVLLRYEAQLTNKEIAVVLQIEPKTVSSLLAKALREIKDHLNQ